jgi:N-acetylneuraminate synthase
MDQVDHGERAQRLKLGPRWIGDGEPVFLIAEAGSNHNGSLEQALRLIDVAAEVGADAVKFQHFKASKLYPQGAGQSDYLGVPKSIYSIIEEMETPDDWVPRLASYAREKGLEFLSSPFDEASADLLAPHVNAFKVASYEMTHLPLLRHIARLGKPLLMSTGTATLDEVVRSVEVIHAAGNDQVVVLQCTASYPTPPEAVNVRALVALRAATGHLVGLSDHSRDPLTAPLLATALGACVIEKHYTLSNRLPGPDHQFAVEPHELRALVAGVRLAEQMLGHGRKETLPAEAELHAFARRSVFTTRPIRAGERLDAGNVAVLRTGKLGTGLPPEAYDRLLGRTAARDLEAERLVSWDDVADLTP